MHPAAPPCPCKPGLSPAQSQSGQGPPPHCSRAGGAARWHLCPMGLSQELCQWLVPLQSHSQGWRLACTHLQPLIPHPPPPSLAPPASHSLQAQGGSPTPQYPQTYHRASPAPNPAPRQGTPLSNTSGTKKPQQFLPITKLIPASPSHTHQCSQSQEHLH